MIAFHKLKCHWARALLTHPIAPNSPSKGQKDRKKKKDTKQKKAEFENID